ncbi:MAG: RnfABCDGE type electron transport complex subunit D [Lachnospiraceae bacterium]|jgi:Na+-translocating ferredoxin:NAD+ oxidoreductase RnfD subunit|nr:RnfABCDGE type electron transport complex subunit D [Lachnospiraceae bacterium]
MSDLLKVSVSPHIRSRINTGGIMLAVIVALMPATGFGIFHFGLTALYLILVTSSTAVLTETVVCLLLKKPVSIGDYSAVVTGLLLALCLPVETPLWLGAAGGIFAIFIVKMLFGGLGQNFMNPAMAALCFLVIVYVPLFFSALGTPLQAWESGQSFGITQILFGQTGAAVGDASLAAILAGAIFLILLGIINLRVPGTYIVSFLLFIVLFTGHYEPAFLIAQIASGSLVLGAFFMASDPVTKPRSAGGQLLYGVILGLFTALFRLYGPSGWAVPFAIILANLLVPLIDKFCTGKKRIVHRRGGNLPPAIRDNA